MFETLLFLCGFDRQPQLRMSSYIETMFLLLILSVRLFQSCCETVMELSVMNQYNQFQSLRAQVDGLNESTEPGKLFLHFVLICAISKSFTASW